MHLVIHLSNKLVLNIHSIHRVRYTKFSSKIDTLFTNLVELSTFTLSTLYLNMLAKLQMFPILVSNI